MCRNGSIAKDGNNYRTLRPLKGYRGNPDAIDITGTVAAEHMKMASALRVA